MSETRCMAGRLQELALLYLIAASREGLPVGDGRLEAVIDQLQARCPTIPPDQLRALVLEAFDVLLAAEDPEALLQATLEAVEPHLSQAQRQVVLHDLLRIVEADGIVMESERQLLEMVARRWGLEPPYERVRVLDPGQEGIPEVLIHLALLYLVLAHGVDHELTRQERQIIVRKLRAWCPDLTDQQLAAVLQEAIDRYAEGLTDAELRASAEAIKMALTPAQRLTAFHDLVQIANADGTFLDTEEDLLNELVDLWELGPHVDAPELSPA
ncbi:TerB family tellurite resistance protein [Rhodothermus marinus]|uniref:Co-chaperone DjlA N-terminal domain-containing protein n=1 Tax=Rhodothermus marinus (strain ATCC 43812 / DSM 4252 / R-10) TaxID=518766 RepID=D0MJK9_RHOM4|nr:TerB family tellurite resistance protein [Rhodothermus marinus]ACY48667.1 hypothetical protein Rmar_1783 [Rhodothermus marinus DSM 4252]